MPATQQKASYIADAELIDRVRSADPQALQTLLDRYWSALLAFAARFTGCEDAAEDVVQRAFIKLWEQRERWRPGSTPKVLLYTIVRNLALHQVDSERARDRRQTRSAAMRGNAVTPAQVLDERELLRALDRALEDLPPRRREAIVLARFHHLTHAEIAGVMGVTTRTVTNHITIALAELEIALGRFLER